MGTPSPRNLPPSVDAAVATRCGRQFGVIHRRQARALGLTRDMERRRLRTGRLFEIHPGVFALTPTLSEDGRRAAALLWAQGTLGYESVLALYDLVPGPRDVHVICATTKPAPSGVRLHRSRFLPDADIRRVRGLRATTVARALLDVAPHTPAQRLRRIVHEAQYRRLIDPLTLRGIFDTHPGHPGLAALGAIDAAPRGTESGLEGRLHRALALVPGARPTPQFRMTLPSGRRIRADAAYVEERVLIEADGRDAHARMLAFAADRARDNETLEIGWTPLRYTGADLARPDAVARQVRALLRR